MAVSEVWHTLTSSYLVNLVFNKEPVFGLYVKMSQQVFGAVAWESKKMNLNINILTKERIANLDIFLYFIINYIKSQKKKFNCSS